MKLNYNFDSIYKNKNDLFESNPKNIQYFKDIVSDINSNCYFDNIFIIFKSINNIYYLIYSFEYNII